jgi:signal transduction histidine kinase/CheY-like chemotaxis protein
MNALPSSRSPDTRLSIGPVLALLTLLALIAGLLSDLTQLPRSLADLAVWLFVMVLGAGLLGLYREAAGRWATAFVLSAAVWLGAVLLAKPELICLAGLIAVFAATVVGPRVGTLFAAVQCVALGILALGAADWAFSGMTTWIAEVGLLLGMASIWALYVPVRQQLTLAAGYLEEGRRLKDVALSRQQELAQALDNVDHLNQQLMLTTQQLDRARQAAEEANKLKADFLARVSHELRTPLNMIIGFGEMILDRPEMYGMRLPPALLADLEVIRRNSQHLSGMVNDVLDLSRMDAGQMPLVCERTPLLSLVESSLIAVKPLYESKGLYLEYDVEADLPRVYCDPTRIRQVILNLLSNAGRFTESGGVTLRALREGPDVHLSVRDTGPGISPDALDKVFRPFLQLEDPLRRRRDGTGLGLAISRSFVAMHGGRMWLESIPNEGTTFHVCLPIDPVPPLTPTATRWIEPSWEYRQRLSLPHVPEANLRLRLMVVEPGQALRRLLERHVQGIELVPAKDLTDGLARLPATPVQAMVVNSLSVPQTLRELVQYHGPAASPPAIVCCVPDPLETVSASNVQDYLLKPVARKALLDVLARLGPSVRTILVVDDEPEELRMFWRMLSADERGYRVLTANDGEQALRIMRESAPDVVLLDLVMPRMDGFQLLEERSQDPALLAIPVVVITALDPSGQPIVGGAVAMVAGSGLSVHQLLNCIEGLSQLFAPANADQGSEQAVPG